MTAPVFDDTNVFVYAVDAGIPEKHRSAQEWEEWLWRTHLGRTSFQVLQEFFVAVTRKQPEVRDAARKEIRNPLNWQPQPIEPAVLELGWKIQDRYQLSFLQSEASEQSARRRVRERKGNRKRSGRCDKIQE